VVNATVTVAAAVTEIHGVKMVVTGVTLSIFLFMGFPVIFISDLSFDVLEKSYI
jgi:hypothetical protein